MEKETSIMEKFLDWLGGICAFLTVLVYALLIIHSNWAFLPASVVNILAILRTWAPLVVVGITGLEFTRGKSLLLKLIFYILVAVVVIFMFFPATWDQFVGFLSVN